MRTKRAFKEFCVLGGLASSVCGVAQERPNIIVFLVDDMGLMDTSVPFIADESGQPVRHPLNDWYHTPNMERLAKQGICFSTFYAQSVSSPSRASIMTGQNATRHIFSETFPVPLGRSVRIPIVAFSINPVSDSMNVRILYGHDGSSGR